MINLFKFLRIIFVGVVCTFYSNCFSQDNANLIGTWQLLSVERQSCTDTSFGGVVQMNCNSETCYELVLTGDGRFTMSSTEHSEKLIEKGSYIIIGDSLKQCPMNGSDRDCVSGIFLVMERELTLTYYDGEEDSGCDIILSYKKI